ncbi:hypothetical protein [Pseudonocardia sp. HH130630-07]|uniref:hypothetical protein n=1 Tax=Pseudonocardia sp. HH130630-07 TaxID=1690815 RepID=UPI000814FB78|nr:hypothetical protein [Pseudonocardia sp. HH130630-07]ANY08153.1 hypothetical protein AFB00_19790 [Pseudonocardia sp. HH130630-07]
MSGLAVVAWVALAGCVAAGALLVIAHRRIERLERAHSAWKWDLVALRAELRSLRRAVTGSGDEDAGGGRGPDVLHGSCPAGPGASGGGSPDPTAEPGVAAGSAVDPASDPGAEPESRTAPRFTGPTAWRRSHGRRPRPRRRPY